MLKFRFKKSRFVLILLLFVCTLTHGQIPCDPNIDAFCPPTGGDPDLPLDDNVIYIVAFTCIYGVFMLKRNESYKASLLGRVKDDKE